MEIGTRMQAGIKVTVNRASQEQWQNQDRKHENLLENACENTSNVKQGFHSGPFSAQSVKHIIFCTAQGGNAPPKVMVLKPVWAGKHRLAHDIGKKRFSKMCFPPMAGSTFLYNLQIIEEKSCQQASTTNLFEASYGDSKN